MGFPGKKPSFHNIGMGKRLIRLRIPGPDQKLCTAGKSGQLFSGEYHDFQFQTTAGIGHLAVEDTAPVVAVLPQL